MANDAKYSKQGVLTANTKVLATSQRLGYQDCDPNDVNSVSTEVHSPTHLNMVQEEIAEAVVTSGQGLVDIYDEGDRSTYSQLAKAMSIYGSGGAIFYKVDVNSTANNIKLQSFNAVGSVGNELEKQPFLFDGMKIAFVALESNTGPVKIDMSMVDLGSSIFLKNHDGSDLGENVIKVGSRVEASYSKAENHFVLLNHISAMTYDPNTGLVTTKMTNGSSDDFSFRGSLLSELSLFEEQDSVLYVDGVDGDDSKDGQTYANRIKTLGINTVKDKIGFVTGTLKIYCYNQIIDGIINNTQGETILIPEANAKFKSDSGPGLFVLTETRIKSNDQDVFTFENGSSGTTSTGAGDYEAIRIISDTTLESFNLNVGTKSGVSIDKGATVTMGGICNIQGVSAIGTADNLEYIMLTNTNSKLILESFFMQQTSDLDFRDQGDINAAQPLNSIIFVGNLSIFSGRTIPNSTITTSYDTGGFDVITANNSNVAMFISDYNSIVRPGSQNNYPANLYADNQQLNGSYIA